MIEKWENFVRQSYRSRCYINGANGVLPLSVPVEGGRKKILVKDIKIHNDSRWKDEHVRSIMSAYGKAPFYEHYIDQVLSFFGKNHKFLLDLSLESMTLCLKMLNTELKWQETEDFVHEVHPGEKDFRNAFNAKNLLDFPEFFKPVEHFQLFGKQFVANLSVLDLIMCEGPQSSTILRSSFKLH